MSRTVTPVNTAADTFSVFIQRTNEVINIVSNEAITANVNANGAQTTGNAYLNGIFGANTIAVFNGIRGGNVQTSNTLPITSNVEVQGKVSVGNSTVNLNINSTHIVIGTTIVNASLIFLGNSTVNTSINSSGAIFGSVEANQTHIKIGNSTINVVANSSSIVVGNAIINSSTLFVGNSTINSTINSTTISSRDANVSSNVSVGSQILVGANVLVNTTSARVGNSTVNAVLSQSTLTISSATVNSSINATAISLQNSTVSFVISKPTAAQVADGGYFLNANGSYAQFSTPNTGLSSGSFTTTGTSAHSIDSYQLTNDRLVDYIISIKDNTANGYQSQRLSVLHDGGDTLMSEYAVIISNASLGSWTANSNSTHARIWFTPVPSNTTIKFIKMAIGV